MLEISIIDDSESQSDRLPFYLCQVFVDNGETWKFSFSGITHCQQIDISCMGFPMGKAELCLAKPDTFVMEIQEVIKPTPTNNVAQKYFNIAIKSPPFDDC